MSPKRDFFFSDWSFLGYFLMKSQEFYLVAVASVLIIGDVNMYIWIFVKLLFDSVSH